MLDFLSRPGWLMRMASTPSPTFVNYGKRTSIGAFGPLMAEQLDPDIGWSDVDWLTRAVARAAPHQGPLASRRSRARP